MKAASGIRQNNRKTHTMEKPMKGKGRPAHKRALVPHIKKGKYSDGHPLDDLHYLECKLILNGDRFTSVESFYEFTKLVKQAAEAADVSFSRKGFKDLRPAIREVLFLDTADFRLYNNAFILRRRQNISGSSSRRRRCRSRTRWAAFESCIPTTPNSR